jgi:MFS family permease
MGGINLVVYYVTSVLEKNVGLSRNMSLILGGCVQIMFVVGSLLPTFALDQLGRRNPMMWGSAGLAVSMMLIAVLLSFQERGGELAKATSSASVSFFFTYMLFFGATANCIPWVYVPEILPLHVRAKGTAIGISANWIWNFFVVMISKFAPRGLRLCTSWLKCWLTSAPIIIERLKWKAYLIFMATNFCFIPLVYYCYPETTRLTLEEIDWLFTKPGAVKRSLRVRKYGWEGDEGMHAAGAETPPDDHKHRSEHVEEKQ